MVTGVHHESATIYAFPAKRFASTGPRHNIDMEAAMAPCVYDSCWYHDDAMKQEEAPAKPRFTPRIVD
jgi:hypothetical protein